MPLLPSCRSRVRREPAAEEAKTRGGVDPGPCRSLRGTGAIAWSHVARDGEALRGQRTDIREQLPVRPLLVPTTSYRIGPTRSSRLCAQVSRVRRLVGSVRRKHASRSRRRASPRWPRRRHEQDGDRSAVLGYAVPGRTSRLVIFPTSRPDAHRFLGPLMRKPVVNRARPDPVGSDTHAHAGTVIGGELERKRTPLPREASARTLGRSARGSVEHERGIRAQSRPDHHRALCNHGE